MAVTFKLNENHLVPIEDGETNFEVPYVDLETKDKRSSLLISLDSSPIFIKQDCSICWKSEFNPWSEAISVSFLTYYFDRFVLRLTTSPGALKQSFFKIAGGTLYE